MEKAGQLDGNESTLTQVGLEASSRMEPGGLPTVLGDFELGREIGRGGMGVVFEARQRSLDRTVAVKVLLLGGTVNANQIQRFQHEARAAATLEHPNIVPVYFVGHEDGVHYYAMQRINGNSLSNVIRERSSHAVISRTQLNGDSSLKEGNGSEDRGGDSSGAPLARGTEFFYDVARVGLQTANALQHAHQLGILHRDIKPGNLLLDVDDKVWVADFGLARIESEEHLTTEGQVGGTLRYMAPERLSDETLVEDQRADVYSLGATLYELVSLQPAYQGSERQVLRRQIEEQEPQPLRRLVETVPVDLETIILTAMNRDRDARYPTAQALADDLDRFLDHRPILARRPSVWERTRKWLWRHQIPLAASALTLVAAVAVGFAMLWVERNKTLDAYRHADVQRQRTEHNLSLALRALDEICLGAIEQERLLDPLQWLRHERPISEHQRNVLTSGLAFYREFATENEHDERLSLTIGKAYRRIGAISRKLDDPEGALLALKDGVGRLEEYLAAHPEDGAGHLELAETYVLVGKVCRPISRHPEADDAFNIGMKHARRATELNPDQPAAYANVGYIYVDRRQYDKAVNAFENVVRLDPESVRGHHFLAMCYRHVHRYDEALAHSGKAISLDPQDGILYQNRGSVYMDLRQHEQAIADFTTAIELVPAGPLLSFHGRGWAYFQLGRLDEAVEDLNRAVELDRSFGLPYTSRAKLHTSRKDYAQALADYTSAVECDPRRTSNWDSLAWFLITCPDETFRDHARALEIAEEAMKRRPEYKGLLVTLGLARYRAGDFSGAIEALSRADGPGDRMFGYRALILAMAHRQLGNADKARTLFDDAKAWMERVRIATTDIAELCGEAEALLTAP